MGNPYCELVEKWRTEARHHAEEGDRCYHRGDDNEGDLHHQAARYLRQCAEQLELWISLKV